MQRITTSVLSILLALPFLGCEVVQRAEVEAKPENVRAAASPSPASENPTTTPGTRQAGLKGTASRENFFREILYAIATSETPRFDDYTEGSYHVDKLDVFNGLPEVAQAEGLKLRGLILVGPTDFLWAYYVLAFIDEGEQIRVNSLTMPHARITYKSTGTIPPKQYDDLLNSLLQTNVLATELPPKGKCESCPYPEWDYEVLVANWSEGKSDVYYGSLNEPKAGGNVDVFTRTLNGIMGTLKKTYPLEKRRGSKSKGA